MPFSEILVGQVCQSELASHTAVCVAQDHHQAPTEQYMPGLILCYIICDMAVPHEVEGPCATTQQVARRTNRVLLEAYVNA